MRLPRVFVLAIVMCLTIGFSGSYAKAAFQCDFAENSHSVDSTQYGQYCAGTGPGCSYCWDDIVIVG